ncbi:putative 37.2 kDa protein, partial [Frankliniella fusca]
MPALVNSDVPAVPTVSSEHANGRFCHVGMGHLLHTELICMIILFSLLLQGPLFYLGYCRCCNPATLANWNKFKVPKLFKVEYQSLVMTMVLLTRLLFSLVFVRLRALRTAPTAPLSLDPDSARVASGFSSATQAGTPAT